MVGGIISEWVAASVRNREFGRDLSQLPKTRFESYQPRQRISERLGRITAGQTANRVAVCLASRGVQSRGDPFKMSDSILFPKCLVGPICGALPGHHVV